MECVYSSDKRRFSCTSMDVDIDDVDMIVVSIDTLSEVVMEPSENYEYIEMFCNLLVVKKMDGRRIIRCYIL